MLCGKRVLGTIFTTLLLHWFKPSNSSHEKHHLVMPVLQVVPKKSQTCIPSAVVIPVCISRPVSQPVTISVLHITPEVLGVR